MGPRDPILATGLPLHGETQAGVAIEQRMGGLVRTEYHWETAGPARQSDLCQARPTTAGCVKGTGVSRWCLGLILPACHQLQEHRTPLHSAPKCACSSG